MSIGGAVSLRISTYTPMPIAYNKKASRMAGVDVATPRRLASSAPVSASISPSRSLPPASGIVLPSFDAFRAAKQRLTWLMDPVAWCKDRLGEDLWSKQREILLSLVHNRYTAVPSCYESGKSFVAARAVCWWIDTHLPGTARAVTTACTGDHVKAVLWHEIGRAHAKGKLPGRLNQTEWWLDFPDPDNPEKQSREELVAFGRKPAEQNPTALAGIHEQYILVIVDEAEGFPEALMDGIKGLLGNEHARLLLIGNPEDPFSPFAKACMPGSKYNTIKISAFDTPNFTGEKVSPIVANSLISPLWVEERREEWGEESPMYVSKVRGEFPENSENSLITVADVRAAQARWNEAEWERLKSEALERELGIDVGGGNNRNVICLRLDQYARITLDNSNPDTMVTLSNTLAEVELYGATAAKIDAIGIGHGAADRAGEISRDHETIKSNPQLAARAKIIAGVEVGRTAIDSAHYVNLRAEGYWTLREISRAGLLAIDPKDDVLAAQLSGIRWKYTAGRIQVESKADMRARNMPSPDKADALMLAFLKIVSVRKPVYDLTW